MLSSILLGIAALGLLLAIAATAIVGGAVPLWGWVWVAVITAGVASVGLGLKSARDAGSEAKQASQIADRITDRYGQSDQSAALRTCLRLALNGKDCEGNESAGGASLPSRGARAEKCGYSEDKCMSSDELSAFGKCMRGDDIP